MYVFKDDALFRGCSESLKHLDMRIDIPAINMLTEYGVVEKLRNLRSINIKFGYSSHGYGDKSTRPLQFAFELVSQSTRSLVLRDFLDDYSIAETIAQYPNMQSLVHLNLSSVKLKLTEVIEVIKILPNLEYFRYTCNGLGSVPGRLQSKNIPRHVLKKYYPLSLRLKYCDINTFANKPTKSLAITAMLLALLCPRFTFAKVPDEVLAAYNSTIENSICDEPYLEFSDRLQCLLR
ncbi:hypothetical protein H4217_000419 [Coemansia sp. RSA 1939]|nr:hypothetical protein H4217_000419 [Coemansia sp. RSA 1939]